MTDNNTAPVVDPVTPVVDPAAPVVNPPPPDTDTLTLDPVAPVVAPTDSPTVLSGDLGDAGDKDVSVQADWPTDWKEKFAEEDPELKKWADRFGSVKDALQSGFEAQKKLRSGKKEHSDFPADGTPEEQAQFRKDNGVPEKPEDYKLELSDGMIVGDNDRPYVDAMSKTFHEMNLPDTQVSKILDGYFKMQEEARTEISEHSRTVAAETVDELRQEYGADYRANLSKSKAYFNETFGEELASLIMNSQSEDGVPLGNNLEFNRKLVSMAHEKYPAGVITPNTSNPLQSINDEIATLEARMGTQEWASDKKSQDRYVALVASRSHHS